ncbi:MAG: hypothetical protein RR269_03880 [Oscillospiraceae bacterium]
MRKRLVSIVLLIAAVFAFSGCTAAFPKEYLSVSDYSDASHPDYKGDIWKISDYDQLKNAIISMVNGHKVAERLKFINYEGTLTADIAKACGEVKTETALGGFAVDYMSHDLGRVATYYEATIYIKYKRTQSEIDNIRYISGKSEMTEIIASALDGLSGYVALRMNAVNITEQEVLDAVAAAYLQNPACCVVPPKAVAKIYPQTGLTHILEIELDYGMEPHKLQKMKSALGGSLGKLSSSISTPNKSKFALDAYRALAKDCEYDPDGSKRRANSKLEDGLGSTVYGVMVEKCADSLGLALAFKALCATADIDCFVVNGNLDNVPHSWNIIMLEDSYYHVDVSADESFGISKSFLRSDGQMAEGYVWQREMYPICNGTKGFTDILERAF